MDYVNTLININAKYTGAYVTVLVNFEFHIVFDIEGRDRLLDNSLVIFERSSVNY